MRPRHALVISAALGALLVICVLSLAIGALPLAPAAVWHGLVGSASPAYPVVHQLRLPRTLLGLLAGSAVNAALYSYVGAVELLDTGALDRMRFWTVGSLADADPGTVARITPFVLAGGALAFGCVKPFNALLRALARVLRPAGGTVLLDGTAIGGLPSRQVARTVGLLPQSPITPDGITVAELVGRGRFPHQGPLRRESPQDRAVIEHCLAETALTELRDRPVAELSGGQRQRAWIAMALAQDTELLLLDEPTTFLDLAHQIEVLDLCARLHRDGRTVVAVLHDLNQAARYASHLIALRDGAVLAQGAPDRVITPGLVDAAFGLRARVIEDPESGTPLVIPAFRGRPDDSARGGASG